MRKMQFIDFLILKNIPFEENPDNENQLIIKDTDLEPYMTEINELFPLYGQMKIKPISATNYKQGPTTNPIVNNC